LLGVLFLSSYPYLLLAATLFTSACQVSDDDNSFRSEQSPEGVQAAQNGVYGEWEGLPDIELPDGAFATVLLQIQAKEVSVVHTCHFADGTSLQVTASADANVQQKSITIAQAVENTRSLDDRECSASLDAGVLGYGVTVDQMQLLRSGKFFQLQRR